MIETGNRLANMSWVSIFMIIVFLATFCVAYFIIVKVLNWQTIKTIIPEIIKHIIDVERACQKGQLDADGKCKFQAVVEHITNEHPDIAKVANKSVFKNIGRLVQYVFTNYAEPIIMKKMGK